MSTSAIPLGGGGKCLSCHFSWEDKWPGGIVGESSCRPGLCRWVVIDSSFMIRFIYFFFLFYFILFFLFRVYEKGVMVRLSGVRLTIGEDGVGEMGVGEIGISEVGTIIIMYNTYVLYPMFVYAFCIVYLSEKFIS